MSGEYDIVIAGGGLAGISLACALAPGGARMAVIEATPPKSDRPPSFDDRAIALAHGSRRIFEAIGLWKNIAGTATPIQKIHVSERGRFGFTHLDATEEGVPALGYVATARDLGQALLESFSTTGIDYYSPARLVDFDNQDDSVVMEIESGEGKRQISAKLLVAADGGQSQIRQRLGIDVRRWEYGHTAVVSNVLAGKPHANIAYERFTPNGPLAFLPMTDNRFGVVLTVPTEEHEAILALDDASFIALLQERFGYRLGRFVKVGQRHAYPLQLLQAREFIRPRMALIGNAVHTLHPVAGQGFNLGLRDVAALAEVVTDARRQGLDIGDNSVLARYADWRQTDQRRAVAFTDTMVRLFGQSLPPVAWLRDAGMLALDICPPAKRWFGRLTMGRAGRLPRLARGLEL